MPGGCFAARLKLGKLARCKEGLVDVLDAVHRHLPYFLLHGAYFCSRRCG